MDANEYVESGGLLSAKSCKDKMLDGKTFTISDSENRDFDNGQKKIALTLEEVEDSKLALNSSNTRILIEAFGSDTKLWKGKKFMLLIIPKNFQGQMVDGIVVKAIKVDQ